MSDTTSEVVRIDSEAKAMLERMAKSENRTLSNMVSTLVKRANVVVSIPNPNSPEGYDNYPVDATLQIRPSKPALSHPNPDITVEQAEEQAGE